MFGEFLSISLEIWSNPQAFPDLIVLITLLNSSLVKGWFRAASWQEGFSPSWTDSLFRVWSECRLEKCLNQLSPGKEDFCFVEEFSVFPISPKQFRVLQRFFYKLKFSLPIRIPARDACPLIFLKLFLIQISQKILHGSRCFCLPTWRACLLSFKQFELNHLFDLDFGLFFIFTLFNVFSAEIT